MSAAAQQREPARGLPEPLPPGERVLWQGAPEWRALARRALHVRKVAVYFAAVAVWLAADALVAGAGAATALGQALSQVAVGAAAVGILALLAWLMGRTTVYTITDQRVVLRLGVALPVTVNLPYAMVDSADLRHYRDGTADLALALNPEERVSYLLFWPHVRPWCLRRPRPMLRVLPDAERAAAALAGALAASQGQGAAAVPAAAPGSAVSPRVPEAAGLALDAEGMR